MPIRPHYAESFRCIGSACEDTCCQGWSVPIDQAAHQRYLSLPPSPLRTQIVESIQRAPEAQDTAKPAAFARIRMTASNQCPMLSEDRLCRIQQEYGEALLSHACATYPRIVHTIGGRQEIALSLSCPEAARLVLLNPRLLQPGALIADGDVEESEANGLPPGFWPIRGAVLALIANRAYLLWQRLFLLGILCRRLDSIASGDLKIGIPQFLRGFQASLAPGSLHGAMDALPVDPALQLDVVLRLAGMMLHRSNVRPRFVECIAAFTQGIGNGPGASLESLAAHFAAAHDRYYAPFFARHPHILENLLINTIFRCQFPYGRDGIMPGAAPLMSKEFALLTGQFALLKGLLIGVAGFHREGFCADHVIHTVQAASKHFEHHPEFLSDTYALLAESQMDGARGLAILLRNEAPKTGISPTLGAPVLVRSGR